MEEVAHKAEEVGNKAGEDDPVDHRDHRASVRLQVNVLPDLHPDNEVAPIKVRPMDRPEAAGLPKAWAKTAMNTLTSSRKS